MADKKPIITVRNLTKIYDKTTAVDNISFEVYEGEIFGLLGPNGAGKTTTLEIMETLRPATSGEVTVDGLDVQHHSWDIKSRIGVQLQASGFYPELTLVELLRMFAGFYQVEVDPIAVLRRFNLEDKKKDFWQKLSGGQKQRFSLATTLIHEPKIIFLDEPTTGLDPQARVNLWEEIRKIHKDGRTILLTTHYMQEAEELCDRLAIMDQGKIIKIGTPHELIEDLLKTGFTRAQEVKKATLEDVFLSLTGKEIRDT
ncbi:MAG TPA: ABC transporter ATP-binding protein [Candidatus Nanoarchaeia archaeon]|nr:putative multidrug ABC transporter ATP-binding protein YbhF [uncultured archaeon]